MTTVKPVHFNTTDLHLSKKVSMSVRPEKIRIHHKNLDFPNMFSGTVRGSFFLGVEQKIEVETGDKMNLTVRIRETNDMRVFSRGEKVKVGWAKEDGNIYM
jgi:ABC-type Fe3+/spermidine/putrescine transport system ATPase subunit